MLQIFCSANELMSQLSNQPLNQLRRMSITFGIVVFPGSNCDHDSHYVSETVLGQEARLIWHKEASLGDVDVVILPGRARNAYDP